ncbi:probable inactive purple acid phosphatase 27 [Tanacetum coccineum]
MNGGNEEVVLRDGGGDWKRRITYHNLAYNCKCRANIAIQKAIVALQESGYITVYPVLLGQVGKDTEQINVQLSSAQPSMGDWVGVFSPANFNASDNYIFANYSTPGYTITGGASLTIQIINQRAYFSFALFTGCLDNQRLIAFSSPITFENPKALLYPWLAHGKSPDTAQLINLSVEGTLNVSDTTVPSLKILVYTSSMATAAYDVKVLNHGDVADNASDNVSQPRLIAFSSPITFENPKAPLYPRIAHGKSPDTRKF